MRDKIIDLIYQSAKRPDGFDLLEAKASKFTKKQLSDNILDCGVMPEFFDHDSSEEKMWSKYSDVILSLFFHFSGLKSEVLGARGNSADVFAKSANYTIVGDAKTFRLSRTAKNQKDFKVEALDSWRQNNNYSVLAAPLFQYPTRSSQIYNQAIRKNVTLVSYVHLKFMLNFGGKLNLEPLWNVGASLQKSLKQSQYPDSRLYWKKIDEVVCAVTKRKNSALTSHKKSALARYQQLGNEGISYWMSKIAEYKKLPREKAITLLIKAHKIDSKIIQIKKAISITL